MPRIFCSKDINDAIAFRWGNWREGTREYFSGEAGWAVFFRSQFPSSPVAGGGMAASLQEVAQIQCILRPVVGDEAQNIQVRPASAAHGQQSRGYSLEVPDELVSHAGEPATDGIRGFLALYGVRTELEPVVAKLRMRGAASGPLRAADRVGAAPAGPAAMLADGAVRAPEGAGRSDVAVAPCWPGASQSTVARWTVARCSGERFTPMDSEVCSVPRADVEVNPLVPHNPVSSARLDSLRRKDATGAVPAVASCASCESLSVPGDAGRLEEARRLAEELSRLLRHDPDGNLTPRSERIVDAFGPRNPRPCVGRSSR